MGLCKNWKCKLKTEKNSIICSLKHKFEDTIFGNLLHRFYFRISQRIFKIFGGLSFIDSQNKIPKLVNVSSSNQNVYNTYLYMLSVDIFLLSFIFNHLNSKRKFNEFILYERKYKGHILIKNYLTF